MNIKRQETTLKDLRGKLLPIIGNARVTYYVYVKLTTGEIVILKRFTEKDTDKFKFIGVAKGAGKELLKSLKDVIYEYNNLCRMTKTEVIKKFGKKGIMECAFICTRPNPHYKCAGDMTWYDKYVIKANLKNNEAA